MQLVLSISTSQYNMGAKASCCFRSMRFGLTPYPFDNSIIQQQWGNRVLKDVWRIIENLMNRPNKGNLVPYYFLHPLARSHSLPILGLPNIEFSCRPESPTRSEPYQRPAFRTKNAHR